MGVPWHHIAKTEHHHSHCQCPILESPLLLEAVLRLCSLYSYITCQEKHTLNGIFNKVLHNFCASYIQTNSSKQQSENCYILLVHMNNKLRTNWNILMEQHLPQWWWGLLEHRQIQISQLSRLQKPVQSTLLLIQVSLCCQSVKDKHLAWVLLSSQSERTDTKGFRLYKNIHNILLLSVHRTHPLFLQSVFIIHNKGLWYTYSDFPPCMW